MNSTESHALMIPTANPSHQTGAANQNQIINIGVSKRRKILNDAAGSCVVCSFPSIKGKPGKNCNQCGI